MENIDKPSVEIDTQKSTLAFRMEKGKSLDLAAFHAALKKTRLGKSAGSQVSFLQLTAVGQITGEKELRLRVKGTNQELVLAQAPDAQDATDNATLFQRLQKERGSTDIEVTGRLEGWKGRFPEVLKKDMPRVPVLLVTGYKVHE